MSLWLVLTVIGLSQSLSCTPSKSDQSPSLNKSSPKNPSPKNPSPKNPSPKNPSPKDPPFQTYCIPHQSQRCAHLAQTTKVFHHRFTLKGHLNGERVSLPKGKGTWVFYTTLPLEIHQVYLDQKLVFDVVNAFDGQIPKLSVHPIGRPLTLHIPHHQSVEILFRSSAHMVVDATRFTPLAHPLHTQTVAVRVYAFQSFSPDLFQQVEALLPFKIQARYIKLSSTLLARFHLTQVAKANVKPIRPSRPQASHPQASHPQASHPQASHPKQFTQLHPKPVVQPHSKQVHNKEFWVKHAKEIIDLPSSNFPEIPIILTTGLAIGKAGFTPSIPLSPFTNDGYILIDVKQATHTLPLVIAHEIAHALGLFHISEPNGAQLESIPDTATCLFDRNQAGIVNHLDCPEISQNLMFWTARLAHLTTAQKYTLQQSYFLIQSPL